MSDVPNHRSNNFDFIRLVAASAVVFSHSYELSGNGSREPLAVLTREQYSIGHLAVDCFFILSGFLITQSWTQSRGLPEYFVKRVLRIYPGFIVVSLFCAFVVGPLGAEHASAYWAEFSPGRFLRRMAMLLAPATPPVFPNLPHPYSINGSLGTISYEAICYCTLPLLAWLGGLKHRRVMLVMAAVFYVAYFLDGHFHYLPNPPLFSPALIIQQTTFFFAGATVYLFRDQLRWQGRYAALCLLGLAAGLLLHSFAWATPLALPYLLVWFATNPRLPLHQAAKYGDFSYGVYLYAYALQQLIVQWTDNRFSPWGLFAIALPASFLCALLSWHLVESPALRLKRRLR